MPRKIRQACDYCRIRKKRCDGKEPICGRCLSGKLEICTYSHHLDKRRPFSKAYVRSLEHQIKMFALELQKPKEDDNTSVNINGSETCKFSGIELHMKHSDENRRSRFDYTREDDCESLDGRIDKFGKFHIVKNTFENFYGPRSIMSFIENGEHSSAQVPVETKEQVACSVSELEKLYIDLYLAYQNVLFSFVWKESFEKQLALPPLRRDKKIFSNGLLFAIFAMGSSYHNGSRGIPNADNNYYAIMADKQLQEEIKAPQLCTIQTAGILSAFYAQSGKDELSSYYCGVAVTTCYTLGLNVEYAGFQTDDSLHSYFIETRKIAFWCTYFLDKALNNMLGRPSLIRSSSITCTIPGGEGLHEYGIWKDPCLTTHLSPKARDSSFLREYSQFSFTAELFILLEKPLDSIYLFFKPASPSKLEMIVAQAMTSLLDFEASLPFFMRLNHILSRPSSEELCPGLFYFQIRLHYSYILLNRVFFIRGDYIETDACENIKPYQNTCYRSSVTISNLISRYREIFGFSRFDVFLPDMVCSAAILLHYFLKTCYKGSETEAVLREPELLRYYKNLRDFLAECSQSSLWSRQAVGILDRLEVES